MRRAEAGDVDRMAHLAEAKREHYRENAYPFQRPAERALEIHRAFLATLVANDAFLALVHENESGRVDGFLIGRLGGAPPPFAARDEVFHVDDFVVEGSWSAIGRPLLAEAARMAEARGGTTLVVVSGTRRVDPAKADFLAGLDLRVEGEWWVKPIEPRPGEPAADGFTAVVAPAPPVYDPGGLTCLALRVDSTEALARLEQFASSANAVLAIVPVQIERADLRKALSARDYVVASELYSASLASFIEGLSR